jgi:uncharacterized protein (DUF2252 family)
VGVGHEPERPPGTIRGGTDSDTMAHDDSSATDEDTRPPPLSAVRMTREELWRAGLDARQRVPFADLARWAPPRTRPDPVDLIASQAVTRLPNLVPVRHTRMSASPFAYYRGAALPMAADLALGPNTGITVQLGGDAHLVNFGLFAAPDRSLVFDMNDFDETLPGPWEWDLKRLAASLVIAGRYRGFSTHDSRHAAHVAVRSYRERMHQYADMGTMAVYYSRLDVDSVREFVSSRARPYLDGTVKAATHHDALAELPKLTEVVDGRRRLVDRPPLIYHPEETRDWSIVTDGLDLYRQSLQEDRRALFDRYRLEDLAVKVVGVGSVGLAALLVLFTEPATDEPLILQVKQAEASVLARYLPASPFANEGERVVTGQRRLQAASDILLGWTKGRLGRHLYLRQHQDQKGSAVIEAMTVADLQAWGALCGWALARGHARSGAPATIAAYLGEDHEVDHAVGDFATAYADQTQEDFASFTKAIAAGRLEVEPLAGQSPT